MMTYNSIHKKIMKIVMLTVSIFLIVIIPSRLVNAGDNGKINVKTVHSFEEMEEVLDGDDSFYSFSGTDTFVQQYVENDNFIKSQDDYYSYWINGGTERKFNIDTDLSQVDESWTVEIDEPGWLVVYEYNNSLRSVYTRSSYPTVVTYFLEKNKEFSKPFLYSNKLLTKPVKAGTEQSQLINGQNFSFLDCERYYCTKGTYYLSYAGGRADWSNCVLTAVFLPIKDIIDVKNIDYSDDYSEAVVTFSVANKNWSWAGIANGKIDSDKALGDKTYWSKYYKNPSIVPDYPQEDTDEFALLLKEGWVIKENGDYSLYYKNGEGLFSGYEGIVTFTIDKLGKEENVIEAKSVKVSKTKATLKIGESITLKTTLKPKNVTETAITWKSSNKKVATVDKNGKVTAKKKGTCTITAITSNGKKAKCKITVKK